MGPPLVSAEQLAAYGDLTRTFIKDRKPQSESFRTYFGRTTDAQLLERALLEADDGYMVRLTDLEGEVLGLDPHLSAVLAKRFGAVSSLDWEVLEAKGPDVDRVAAKEAADMVRQHLSAIPFFGERLYDLLWANYDGRAVLEIHWDFGPRRYPWRPYDLGWVHPRRISFGPRFELRVVDPWTTQGDFRRDGFAPDEIPGKFIHWSPRLFREYPYREGLAPRTLYWSFFKRYSTRMRMILTELFGLPWRIVTQDAEFSQGESKDEALEAAEALGQDKAAAFDPGQKLTIHQPHPESGGLFQMTLQDVNLEMSKLVLGNTGTTDAEGNRAETIIHKGEQDIVAFRDAGGASARLTEHLVKPDVQLNMGRDNLVNAPTFRLKADPMRDRKAEQEIADKTIAAQVPVAVKQYREITGMEEPEEGEPFVVGRSPGTDPVSGAPLPAVPTIVDPPGSLEEGVGVDENLAGETIEDQGIPGAEDRAEADLRAAQRRRDVRNAYSTAITNEPNHGHVLVVPQVDLVEIDGPRQYDIKGEADHGHALMLTATQLREIANGQTVTTEAAPGGERPHTHQVEIARAVLSERATTLPFGGFEDFDDCVATIKAGDPSLSDEAARRICGAMQAKEEQRHAQARLQLRHLLALDDGEQNLAREGGCGCADG